MCVCVCGCATCSHFVECASDSCGRRSGDATQYRDAGPSHPASRYISSYPRPLSVCVCLSVCLSVCLAAQWAGICLSIYLSISGPARETVRCISASKPLSGLGWLRPSPPTLRASRRAADRTPTCCYPPRCHGAMPPEAEEDAALSSGSSSRRACVWLFCWLCSAPALPGYPSCWAGGMNRRGRTQACPCSVDRRFRFDFHHRRRWSCVRCTVRPSPPSPSFSRYL